MPETMDIDACMARYEAMYRLPAGIIRAIAMTESGMQPGAVSPPNADGTKDYGLMQINSRNLERFGVPIREAMDPCTSIALGARILRDGLDAQNGNIFAALRMYNTGRGESSERGDRYAMRVYRAWGRDPGDVRTAVVLTPATPAGRRAADMWVASLVPGGEGFAPAWR